MAFFALQMLTTEPYSAWASFFVRASPLCISKSIDPMKMQLIWCVKHPKMFILVTVTCQLWRHTFKTNPPSWIRHLGFPNCSEMSENLQISLGKNQEKYKDTKTTKILEGFHRKKQTFYEN